MAANAITFSRVFLTFMVVLSFGQSTYIDIVGTVTIAVIFLLDAIDGYVARKCKQTTAFGAVFDIAADRIIENVFWIYFTVNDTIHMWMPMAVVTRGFITDGVRSCALIERKTPFEMMAIPWTRALTSSRISRVCSGVSKMIAFLAMAILHALKSNGLHLHSAEKLQPATVILATAAVAICLIRGVPVLIDGRKYIKAVFLMSR